MEAAPAGCALPRVGAGCGQLSVRAGVESPICSDLRNKW